MPEPFKIGTATPRTVHFAQFVSEPVTSEQEKLLREQVEENSEVRIDLSDTMTLSTDWWRLLGRMGALATRTGGKVVIVGANSVGLVTADRVGAREFLDFENENGDGGDSE